MNLGFLDFSTLAARRHYCEEELRLNRRTAPGLYLDVLAIGGSASAPVIGGGGEAIEYALRMRRFDQDDLLDRMARRGALAPAHIDALARGLAAFHGQIARAGADDAFGSPQRILAPALQNFEQMLPLAGAKADIALLARLRDWTGREHAALAPVFAARKRDGWVRECHGDLHLGNIALLEGVPTPFDGIEFNPDFRWIDVMNEIAFLAMDLFDHRLPRLAFRFVNAYLEATGDYAGLRVLRFYLVYRALVRAKVACLRAHQTGLAAQAKSEIEQEYRRHLHLAERLAAPAPCGAVDHARAVRIGQNHRCPGSARSAGRSPPALRRGTQAPVRHRGAGALGLGVGCGPVRARGERTHLCAPGRTRARSARRALSGDR